jgi:hypothetical protein
MRARTASRAERSSVVSRAPAAGIPSAPAIVSIELQRSAMRRSCTTSTRTPARSIARTASRLPGDGTAMTRSGVAPSTLSTLGVR